MSELKPCPFCGDIDVRQRTDTDWFSHQCQGCGVKQKSYVYLREAIEAWNRRAALTPPAERAELVTRLRLFSDGGKYPIADEAADALSDGAKERK